MSVKLREKTLKDGTISLYLDCYFKKKRWYEFLNIYIRSDMRAAEKRDLRDEAEMAKDQRWKEIRSSENGVIAAASRYGNYVEYFERLCNTQHAHDRSWLSVLKLLQEFTDGHVAFRDVNRDWLEKFKAFLLTKVRQNTARTYFNKVGASLNQAVYEGVITDNPRRYVKNFKWVETLRAHLSMEEVEALAKTPAARESVRRAFMFCIYTGIRISDVKRLTWGNIRKTNLGYQIEFQQKKTKSTEYFPIPKVALSLMGTQSDPEDLVFDLPCVEEMNKDLKEWAANAKIKHKVTWHISRHTFAVWHLERGTDIYTLSKMLGHKRLETTQIYAKVLDRTKQAAANTLPPINLTHSINDTKLRRRPAIRRNTQLVDDVR